VIGKRPHLVGQLEEDVLRHVLGVRFLQAPLAAPDVDLGAVVIDEFRPNGLVGGIAPQPAQKGDACPGIVWPPHPHYSSASPNLALQTGQTGEIGPVPRSTAITTREKIQAATARFPLAGPYVLSGGRGAETSPSVPHQSRNRWRREVDH